MALVLAMVLSVGNLSVTAFAAETDGLPGEDNGRHRSIRVLVAIWFRGIEVLVAIWFRGIRVLITVWFCSIKIRIIIRFLTIRDQITVRC